MGGADNGAADLLKHEPRHRLEPVTAWGHPDLPRACRRRRLRCCAMTTNQKRGMGQTRFVGPRPRVLTERWPEARVGALRRWGTRKAG
jgi:hypothetical protein